MVPGRRRVCLGVMWSYPLLFTWQAFTTWATGLWVMLGLVAVVALVASRRRAGAGPDATESRGPDRP